MKESEGAHDQIGTSHPSSKGFQFLLFIASPAQHSACIQQGLSYFFYCQNEEVEAQGRPVAESSWIQLSARGTPGTVGLRQAVPLSQTTLQLSPVASGPAMANLAVPVWQQRYRSAPVNYSHPSLAQLWNGGGESCSPHRRRRPSPCRSAIRGDCHREGHWPLCLDKCLPEWGPVL